MKALFANLGEMKILLRVFSDDNLAEDFFSFIKTTVQARNKDKYTIDGYKIEKFISDYDAEINDDLIMYQDNRNPQDILIRKIYEMIFGKYSVYFGCGGPDNYTLEDLLIDQPISGWDLD